MSKKAVAAALMLMICVPLFLIFYSAYSSVHLVEMVIVGLTEVDIQETNGSVSSISFTLHVTLFNRGWFTESSLKDFAGTIFANNITVHSLTLPEVSIQPVEKKWLHTRVTIDYDHGLEDLKTITNINALLKGYESLRITFVAHASVASTFLFVSYSEEHLTLSATKPLKLFV